MTGTRPYLLARPMPGKFYVCELGLGILVPLSGRRLAGPFSSEAEANAAAGAIEAEYPHYRARTEVWLSPPSDTEPVAPAITVAVTEFGTPAAT